MNEYKIYVLLVYFLSFILVNMVYRSWLVYRRTGINPVTFGAAGNAHDYAGMVFKMVVAFVTLILTAFWVGGPIYGYMLPMVYLELPILEWTGLVLLMVSALWIFIAQVQMGDSWRVGVDREHKTELVNTGLFMLSRNPIFLGMVLGLLGLFLMVPSGATLLVLVLSRVVIQVQIRLEEEHLTNIMGPSYGDYLKQVRRWV